MKRPAHSRVNRGRLDFLFTEHGRIDQEDKSIAIHEADGSISVPCSMLSRLMLGPGVSLTHSAIQYSLKLLHGSIVRRESGSTLPHGRNSIIPKPVGSSKNWAYPVLRLKGCKTDLCDPVRRTTPRRTDSTGNQGPRRGGCPRGVCQSE